MYVTTTICPIQSNVITVRASEGMKTLPQMLIIIPDFVHVSRLNNANCSKGNNRF